MFTWTETPLTELWNQIRYLQSPTNARNLLSGKTASKRKHNYPDDDALARRARELASCIRQASEYYRAADQVTLTTQPLLQFYGASALAKAVILANTQDTLVDISFHGLSTTAARVPEPLASKLSAYNKDPSQWSLETEHGVVQPNGVFPELCKAIGETAPSPGTVLRFQELLRLNPDISQTYVRHYGEPSHCFYMDVHEQTAEKKLRISAIRAAPEHITRVFPELLRDFDGGGTSFISKAPASLPLPYAATVDGTVAGTYLVRPLDCGLKESLAINFAALFILSNVVRYKPAFWMATLEGHQSGAASIAEAFCNAAKRRLPNDALNAIWHEEFSYGAPARLS